MVYVWDQLCFCFLSMHLPLARFCSVASFTSLPLKSRGQESTRCRCCFPSLELSLFLRPGCRHCRRTWISTSALPPGSMYVGRAHMHYLLIFLGCLLLPCFQLLFPLLVESVAVSVSTYTPWPLYLAPSATTGSLIKRLLSVRNTNSSGTNKHATFTYISCLPHSDAGFELQHTYIP